MTSRTESAFPGKSISSICPAEAGLDPTLSKSESNFQTGQSPSSQNELVNVGFTLPVSSATHLAHTIAIEPGISSNLVGDSCLINVGLSIESGKATMGICPPEAIVDAARSQSAFLFHVSDATTSDLPRGPVKNVSSADGILTNALGLASNPAIDDTCLNNVGLSLLSGNELTGICSSEAIVDTTHSQNDFFSHVTNATTSGLRLESMNDGLTTSTNDTTATGGDPVQESIAVDTIQSGGRTDKLQVYYQNVRGLRTKLDDVFLAISESHYDVIVFTETWLNEQIFSPQLFGNSYTVFRNDRSLLNSRKSRGGGVLIAVSSELNCLLDPTPVDVTLEQLWVKLKLPNCSFSIGVIYLPPDRKADLNSTTSHIESIGAILAHAGETDHVLLLGDYNQSGLVWDSAGNGHPTVNAMLSHISVACAALLDGFSLYGLTQINTINNRNGRLLDLALVNDTALERCTLSAAAEPLSILDADHPPLVVEINASRGYDFEAFLEEPSYDFCRADFESMLEAFLHTDWRPLDTSGNVDYAVDYFTQIIRNAIAEYVPLRRPSPKPVWGNARLRHLRQLRSKALRKYCRSRCPLAKQLFNRASNKYRTYNCFLYKRYTLRMQENLRRHPRNFWKFVKSKRKDNGLPVEMFLRNDIASSVSDKCNLFAEHFKGAFNRSTSSPAQVEDACRNTPRDVFSLRNFQITPQHVKVAINKLKYSTSPSHDGIPSCILKRCGDALIHPLTLLFNVSLQERRFPSSWKISTMFPVYKKGDKRNIENYRGITSLCTCSKIFEIIINNMLFTSCKNYISSDQHGFCPKRSASTNLVQFTSFCLRKMDLGTQVDAVYTDLKSAFDRVDHEILLDRLERLGVSSNLTCWFRSYLADRKVIVKIGCESSEPFTNSSGVPQGSNLGPLLFSIFINELSNTLPPGCRLFYADDVKIYMVVKNTQDCIALQQLIDRFAEWCIKNRLTLSIHKCHVISFHRKLHPIIHDYNIAEQPLERVHQVRDLGVILDTSLTFHLHYNDIISRANRQLGFIFKITNEFRDPLCLRSLYCALVRSILESNAVVWCPYQSTWIARIEAIQRKFVRYALRELPWRDPLNLPNYEDRCRLLGIKTLEDRRTTGQAVFVAKILLGDTDSSEILAQLNIYAPERILRQRDFLMLETRNALYGQHDPIRFMSASFNRMFMMFDFNASAATFKRKLSERR